MDNLLTSALTIRFPEPMPFYCEHGLGVAPSTQGVVEELIAVDQRE